ncbi:MAG: ribonuclease [Chitinophagales bacterium]|nr:ribonuclease [Chitinophagales bacterium]
MNLKSNSKILWGILFFIAIIATKGYQQYFNQPNATQVKTNQNSEILKEQSSPNLNPSDLSDEQLVIAYLKKHHRLLDYYISKREAVKRGWQANKGNLCEVLPGRVIGGDAFGNREGKLPRKEGRKYFEADINYNCGGRNADRIVFSNDQLIYVTKDHYVTFQKR